MRSKIAAGARRARSELTRRARKLAARSGINLDRTSSDLRSLNGKMAVRARRDPGKWIVDALQFALNNECYETAERLARFAQATWPQFSLARRRRLVASVAEALIVIGEKDEARALLDTQRWFFRDDDRIMGLYVLLDDSPHPPSGRLNVLALSRDAIEGGYRDPERRRIAEIAARRRLLGNEIVPGVEIVDRNS